MARWPVALLAGFAACSATPAPHPIDTAWTFRLTLRAEGRVVDVDATLPSGDALELAVAAPAMPFLTVDRNDQALRLENGRYVVAASRAARTLHWQFRAADAARAIDDVELAAWREHAFLGSLGAFLLHAKQDAQQSFAVEVASTPGLAFACASHREGDTWRGGLADLDMLPACVFGQVAVRTIAGERPHLDLVELAPRPADFAKAMDRWALEAVHAVTDYFGTFPTNDLLLVVTPGRSPTITGGSARGFGGARIMVDVPRRPHGDAFRQDWVLFHEMTHLALPSLPAPQHWLEEGSAVYLEPILQVRAGRVTEDAVWAAMLADYAQGLPTPGSGGLDDDHSWGRTYYGGAIFCLEADIEIRSRTGNHRSLQDALRAVVAAGHDITESGTIEQVIAIGDAATGTTVLAELYERWRDAEGPNELDALWARLGVRMNGERVVFDDAAPLAAVRAQLLAAPVR